MILKLGATNKAPQVAQNNLEFVSIDLRYQCLTDVGSNIAFLPNLTLFAII